MVTVVMMLTASFILRSRSCLQIVALLFSTGVGHLPQMVKSRMLQMLRGGGLCLLGRIYMIGQSKILLVFLLLNWGVFGSNVEYLGVSAPFQSPPSLDFQFKSDSVLFDIAVMGGEDGGYYYRQGTVLKKLKIGEGLGEITSELARFDRSMLLEEEVCDVELLLESMKSGVLLRGSQLRGIKSPLVMWAQAVRQGKVRVFRLIFKRENTVAEWTFVGDLYSWRVKCHDDGSWGVVLNSQDVFLYPIKRDHPVGVIIRKVVTAYEADVRNKVPELFGDKAILLFGDISREDTLVAIAKLKKALGY